MADQEHNSTLINQAEGKTGSDAPTAGQTPATSQTQTPPAQGQVHGQTIGQTPGQAQGQAQAGFTGDVSGQSLQGQQNQQPSQGQSSTPQHVPGGDQIGQNMQSYGSSAEQDTTGGQGADGAHLASTGSSGVLGEGPGQSLGQPASPTTGGPDLSKGLVDHNKGGGI